MRAGSVFGYIVLLCIIGALAGLVVSGYSDRVPQDEYDTVSNDLAQVRQELENQQEALAAAQANLTAAEAELEELQAELDDIKYNPVIVEVRLTGHSGIASVESLKFARYSGEGGTYYVDCDLEQTGKLPPMVNVVDVELHIGGSFITSERWIDISSTGYTVVKPGVKLDTGSEEPVDSIMLKFVPAFKVFGSP